MKFADSLKQTASLTSTTTITLGAAAAGFRTLAQAITDSAGKGEQVAVGDTICMRVEDATDPTKWETSIYSITGNNALTRSTILSSSNAGVAVTFGGTVNVICTVPSAHLARLPEFRDISFAVSVPLGQPGQSYMPPQAVSNVLAFTPAANPVRGSHAYVRLTADGVNVPTFAGFKEYGGSIGYDNRNGLLNLIEFFYDGTDAWYSVSQQIAPLPVASALTLTGPTTGQVGTASSNYTVALSPAGSTVGSPVTVTPTPVSGMTFSPTSVQLTTASSSATFTANAATAGTYQVAVTNNGGLSNPSAISYVASSNVVYPRMANLTKQTESGTGPYTYTGTGGGFFSGSGEGVATKAMQANTDGYFTIKLLTAATFGGNEVFFGIDASATPVGINAIDYGVVGHTDGYNAFTSGTSDSTNSTTLGAVNDYVRFKRTGTVLLADVSKDSGATWTTVRTWGSVPTGVMYFHAITANAGAYVAIDQGGLA